MSQKTSNLTVIKPKLIRTGAVCDCNDLNCPLPKSTMWKLVVSVSYIYVDLAKSYMYIL